MKTRIHILHEALGLDYFCYVHIANFGFTLITDGPSQNTAGIILTNQYLNISVGDIMQDLFGYSDPNYAAPEWPVFQTQNDMLKFFSYLTANYGVEIFIRSILKK